MNLFTKSGWRVIGLGFLICLLSSLTLGEEEASSTDSAKSPDGKWEYQLIDSSPVLSEAGTKEPAAELPQDAANSFVEEARIVWAPDSKRFAFNYHAGTRYYTTELYQLKGEKWVKLRPPETEATTKPLEAVKAAQLQKLHLPKSTYRRNISDSFSVDEWVDANTAVLHASSVQSVATKDEDNVDVEARFLFTLKFDADGTWKITKTHQMTQKEIEKENSAGAD
jgi:hypothetical protein